MLALQAELLGTRSEFRLGTRLTQARQCGTTTGESDLYEWNARVQITTWGNRYCADTGGLRDYAHKEWQGLLADFYATRWKTYFDLLAEQMRVMTLPNPEMLGTGQNSNKTADELFQMALPQEVKVDYYAIEEPWTLQHNPYTTAPVGSAVEMAKKAMRLINDKAE
jgi:alpha-N-acetylglucosaminidase